MDEFPVDHELLKSGQFADLCQTTKDTLRHWRSIGLLKPVAVSETGYALYSPLQWADFLLITSLQDSGCSLADIRRYLARPTAAELDEVLAERVDALKAERQRLLRRQRLLENTLRRARALDGWLCSGDRFRLEECAEARFRDIDLSCAFAKKDSAAASEAQQAIDILTERYGTTPDTDGAELQNIYRIGRAAFLDGHPETDFHACLPLAKRYNGNGNQTVRAAGTYLKWLRTTCIADELGASAFPHGAYDELRRELDRRNLAPLGDVFEIELSLYSGDWTETVYTEVSVRVG